MVQVGRRELQVQLLFDPPSANISRGAYLTICFDDKVVGGGRVDYSSRVIMDASETFDVGQDLGSPVSRRYKDKLPFTFNGDISKVNIKYISPSDKVSPPQFEMVAI